MKKDEPVIISENDVAFCIRQSIDRYLTDLNGEEPGHAIYDMVLHCIEKPLLETVLRHAGGNQTRAAEWLGLSRSTLHKKIQLYKIQA
jgi:Fis family transcriptional regulator